MASSASGHILIRKLRKKLRQIENLERINRPLSAEEIEKVDTKFDIREKLQIALEQERLFEEEAQRSGFGGETAVHPASGRQGSVSKDDASPQGKLDYAKSAAKEIKGDVSKATKTANVDQPHSTQQQSQSPSVETTQNRQEKSKQSGHGEGDVKLQKSKKKQVSQLGSECRVTWLEGHNDLITSLAVLGDKVITASRDTTLKCWDVRQSKEIRSYGGHTETVTCVLILGHNAAQEHIKEDDHLIVSGSFDCTFKLWSLNTGQMLKSVYTYNPVTQICYSSTLGCLITGSDGGKLELWDLNSGTNTFSSLAHESSITGVKTSDNNVFSSSSDGIIKVHEVRDGGKLSCVFVSEAVKTLSGQSLISRHIRCLEFGPRGLFYGEDARNIKILDWKKGQVSKLPNHTSNFTTADAICCHGDFMLASSYDLDSGLGYVNVRCNQTLEYLGTLDDKDTGRIVCLDFGHSPATSLFVVTGGTELKLWEMLPAKTGKKRKSESEDEIIDLEFLPGLYQHAVDSESESSYEEDDDEDEDSDDGRGQGWEDSSKGGWMSWCNIL